MDGALLPGIRVDIILALDVRGDLVLPVMTTRLPFDNAPLVFPNVRGANHEVHPTMLKCGF